MAKSFENVNQYISNVSFYHTIVLNSLLKLKKGLNWCKQMFSKHLMRKAHVKEIKQRETSETDKCGWAPGSELID